MFIRHLHISDYMYIQYSLCQTLLKLLGYNLEKIPQETENYCKYRHTACIPRGATTIRLLWGRGRWLRGLGEILVEWKMLRCRMDAIFWHFWNNVEKYETLEDCVSTAYVCQDILTMCTVDCLIFLVPTCCKIFCFRHKEAWYFL